jgi:hypothetical protein
MRSSSSSAAFASSVRMRSGIQSFSVIQSGMDVRNDLAVDDEARG